MEAVNYTNFRKDLKSYFKKINNDSEALVVTNKDQNDDVVVLGKDDYDSLIETLDILSNKYLMDKIERGDEQFAKGEFKAHELLDPEKINDQSVE